MAEMRRGMCSHAASRTRRHPSREAPSQRTGALSSSQILSQSRSLVRLVSFPSSSPKAMSTRVALSRFAPALARAHKAPAFAARRALLVRGYASQSEHSVRASRPVYVSPEPDRIASRS